MVFRSLFLGGREIWKNIKSWAVRNILHTDEYSVLATNLAKQILCRLAPRQQHGANMHAHHTQCKSHLWEWSTLSEPDNIPFSGHAAAASLMGCQLVWTVRWTPLTCSQIAFLREISDKNETILNVTRFREKARDPKNILFIQPHPELSPVLYAKDHKKVTPQVKQKYSSAYSYSLLWAFLGSFKLPDSSLMLYAS